MHKTNVARQVMIMATSIRPHIHSLMANSSTTFLLFRYSLSDGSRFHLAGRWIRFANCLNVCRVLVHISPLRGSRRPPVHRNGGVPQREQIECAGNEIGHQTLHDPRADRKAQIGQRHTTQCNSTQHISRSNALILLDCRDLHTCRMKEPGRSVCEEGSDGLSMRGLFPSDCAVTWRKQQWGDRNVIRPLLREFKWDAFGPPSRLIAAPHLHIAGQKAEHRSRIRGDE